MDRRLSLLYTSLAFALLLGLLQYLSFMFYLTWTFWWFDILMHYFAGVTGGLATYWVLFHSGILYRKGTPSKLKASITVLVCVMIVGVGWEIAEQALGIVQATEPHAVDITIDLIMDALGAVSAALIARRRSHDSSNLAMHV